MANNSLPRMGSAQEISEKSKVIFNLCKPDSWVSKELDGDTDFGIDYFIHLKDENAQITYSFYLQLKGATNPKSIENGKYISQQFKTKTLRLYRIQEPLVMVAVVDLRQYQAERSSCKSYYLWLEEDYLDEILESAGDQENVTIRVPTKNTLDPSLNIWPYYAQRIAQRDQFLELMKAIQAKTDSPLAGISKITRQIRSGEFRFTEFALDIEQSWQAFPTDGLTDLLREADQLRQAGQLTEAISILDSLNDKDLDTLQSAERMFQLGASYNGLGDYETSQSYFENAHKTHESSKYKVSFHESKFRIDKSPKKESLEEIASDLDETIYRECLLKAKCITLSAGLTEGLNLIEKNHPHKLTAKLILATMSNDRQKVSEFIDAADPELLESNRERLTYYALAARRLFHTAFSDSEFYSNELPLFGTPKLDKQSLEKCLENLKEAWALAKELGYPMDAVMLCEISMSAYTIFGKADELVDILEPIVDQRTTHTGFLKPFCILQYSRKSYLDIVRRLEPQEKTLDLELKTLLLDCYYNLERGSDVLRILETYFDEFINDTSDKTAQAFLIGSQIAHEMLEGSKEKKYLEALKAFPQGEEYKCIFEYITFVKQHQDNRTQANDKLYANYTRLDHSFRIAEQLFPYLDPSDDKESERALELAGRIRRERQFYPGEEKHLAEVYTNTNSWQSLADLAKSAISRETDSASWILYYAYALEGLGKTADAIRILDDDRLFESDDLGRLWNTASLLLRLGFADRARNRLENLLTKATDPKKKLNILHFLLFVYSLISPDHEKIGATLGAITELTNPLDENNEAKLLAAFLTLTNKIELDNKLTEKLRDRLREFPVRFPESKILKQVTIPEGNEGIETAKMLKEAAGITDSMILQWKANRHKIRNGQLPLPFSLLQNYLDDVRDIFATWYYAKNSAPGLLEYRVRHAHYNYERTISEEVRKNRIPYLEETSILVLHDIGLLEKFLDSVEHAVISKSFDAQLVEASHPTIGSINHPIASSILSIFSDYGSKIIFEEDREQPFLDSIEIACGDKNGLLLSDDAHLSALAMLDRKDIDQFNFFNILEFILTEGRIDQATFFNSICKFSKLGVISPVIPYRLIASTIKYQSEVLKITHIENTGCYLLLDKVFHGQQSADRALETLLSTMNIIFSEPDWKIEPNMFGEILNIFVLRYNNLAIPDLMPHVIVCVAMEIPVRKEKYIEISMMHKHLWDIYCSLLLPRFLSADPTPEELMVPLINAAHRLPKKYWTDIWKALISAFGPGTSESDRFDEIWTRMSMRSKIK